MDRITRLGKALRKRPTDAEKLLWNHLRIKRVEGFKFRRQQPIDHYIVDFVCFENRIIVEVDGGQHAEEEIRNQDKERTSFLENQEFTVLRFWNNEVLQNINGVLMAIREACLTHPPLNPLPSREGKGPDVPYRGRARGRLHRCNDSGLKRDRESVNKATERSAS